MGGWASCRPGGGKTREALPLSRNVSGEDGFELSGRPSLRGGFVKVSHLRGLSC